MVSGVARTQVPRVAHAHISKEHSHPLLHETNGLWGGMHQVPRVALVDTSEEDSHPLLHETNGLWGGMHQ